MRNRDRCGGSLRGERKGWTEGSKHRVPRARHGRGPKEGGLVPPASRPPGPGTRDHLTQAWRVRVTPTSILAALLHFHSKSMLQVAVGKPRRLPVPSRVRTTLPSQGLLGPIWGLCRREHFIPAMVWVTGWGWGWASGPLSWCLWLQGDSSQTSV